MPYTKFDPNNPPPPLLTSEPNSFARNTITNRIPVIIQQVIADKEYPPAIKAALQELHDEVKYGQPIRPLETKAVDAESWAAAWQPHQGKTWLNVPWYWAEAFLYRRLLEASGFFGGQNDYWEGNDPFIFRKIEELESQPPWQVLAAALSHSKENSDDSFKALLHYCVWGNRIDLSYSKVSESTGRGIVIDSEQANLLVDDTEAVLDHLRQGSKEAKEQASNLSSLLPRSPASLLLDSPAPLLNRPSCLDFICDNAGTELLLDLALADFLLRFNRAQIIALHVKAHPTFVSDATPRDINITLEAIQTHPSPEIAEFGRRVATFNNENRLDIKADMFWNSSRFFWEMPELLQNRLAQARLVIIKGDANYRRLLGDSRWPASVPISDAVPYFPTSFVSLRTLKSDPIVGLQLGQAETLSQFDPEWRVNGKRGIIQALLSAPSL